MPNTTDLRVVSHPVQDNDDPSLFLNRELSFIAFNRRVLELAQDATLPLLGDCALSSLQTSTSSSRFRVSRLRERARASLSVPRRQHPERVASTISSVPR